MNSNNLLFEKLADIEHQRWAHWQKYLHNKCKKDKDGNLIIPKSYVEHLEKQIKTKYEDLTEKEKNSDRDEVKKYWKLINNLSNTELELILDALHVKLTNLVINIEIDEANMDKPHRQYLRDRVILKKLITKIEKQIGENNGC